MAPFDPYHKWLAIPPEEQPPNHYRLLALPLFEFDADVIDAAAEQRTVFLRSFQTGPNAELAERLLNEVSEARVCLLDGKSKARYDQQLQATLEPVPEDDPPGFMVEELAPVASRASTRQRSREGKPFWQKPWAIPAAAGGIVVVLLLVMLLSSGGDKSLPAGKQKGPATAKVDPKPKVSAQATAKPVSPSLQEGLVAYYPFNGNVKDESGNGNDGEVDGATLTIDRHGNADQAYLFDGVDDYIEITDSSSLGPRLITLSAWIRTNSLGTLFYKARFQDAAAEQYDLSIELPETGRQFPALRFSIKRNSNGRRGVGWQRAFSQDHVNTNNWMMVTATFDGFAQRIYIHGELNGINDMESLEKRGIDDLAGNTLQIGRSWATYKKSFTGSLDDIRIYNRALSAAEVKALYEYEKP